MENKRSGFWLKYSEEILGMTRESKKKCVMDAFWCLTKHLIDIYKAKKNKCRQSEFNRHAGYVLHYVVLLDSIAMTWYDLELDYSLDDPNIFDPLDKSTVLSIVGGLSGLAREYYVIKATNEQGIQSFEWGGSADANQMLVITLTRILRYIKSNTDMSLREIASQHIDIYYGRVPTPARGYDLDPTSQ